MNQYLRKRFWLGLRLVMLVTLATIFLFPILMMVSTSLKTSEELYSSGFSLLPKNPTLENYATAFTQIPYFRYMWNTAFITISNVVAQLLVAPMVAYSLSKIQWRGAGVITGIILGTMMLPYFTIMVPLYKIWALLGLTGTKWPLILCAFFGNPLYIIILRQFMCSVPNSLLDAARIDGCSEFQKYLFVMLPLCKPAITTIGIFTFLQTWSDYLGPMLYLSDPKDYTLSIGLKAFISQYTIDWPSLMAASATFIVPVVILFAFFQRNFVEGISTTGLK